MNSSLRTALDIINPDLKHILEFGVYKGKSLRYIRRYLDDSFQVIGFDSFEGLPEDWTGAKTKERIDGKKTGKILQVKKGHFDMQGEVPDIEDVIFYKGWFKDILPIYRKNYQEPIGFIHIDCDLYSSTQEVLFALNDYIIPGTIIAFDDWFYNGNINCNDGEQKAFLEWSEFFKREFDFIAFRGEGSRKVMQKIVKIFR